MKPLLLGECPSAAPGSNGRLFPLSGRVATTLCTFAGLTPTNYHSLCLSFDCKNVLDHEPDAQWWNSPWSRTTFEQIWELATHNSCVVCLGRKTAMAAGIADLPWGTWSPRTRRPIVAIPHPSGLNRLYNQLEYRALATKVLREALTCAYT